MACQVEQRHARRRNKTKYLVISIGVAIAVVVLWLLTGRIAYWVLGDIATGAAWLENRGLFGDSYGAINALFSGLAFGGVIIAILMQSEELELQRDELADTRTVFEQQRFENTFFQMLSQWTSQLGFIEVGVGQGQVVHNKRALRTIYGEFKSLVGNKPAAAPEQITPFYEEVYKRHGDHLGHYFRGLYHIIKFVDRSNVKNKRLYTAIARAQLSATELSLLLYNCLTQRGSGFKPLVEKYGLLKNLEDDYLIAPSHRSFFAGNAFVNPPMDEDCTTVKSCA